MTWALILVVLTGNYSSATTIPFETKALCELAAHQLAKPGQITRDHFSRTSATCVQVKP